MYRHRRQSSSVNVGNCWTSSFTVIAMCSGSVSVLFASINFTQRLNIPISAARVGASSHTNAVRTFVPSKHVWSVRRETSSSCKFCKLFAVDISFKVIRSPLVSSPAFGWVKYQAFPSVCNCCMNCVDCVCFFSVFILEFYECPLFAFGRFVSKSVVCVFVVFPFVPCGFKFFWLKRQNNIQHFCTISRCSSSWYSSWYSMCWILRTRLRGFTRSFAWIYALVCAILRTRLRYSTQSSVVSVTLSDKKTSVYKLGNVAPCRGRWYVEQVGKVFVSCKAWFILILEAGNLGKQYPFIWVQLAKIPQLERDIYAFTLHRIWPFQGV